MALVMTPTLTSVLGDIVNNRPRLDTVLKKWQSVARQEDQLEADDKVLVSNHLNNLLCLRQELNEMAQSRTEPNDLKGLPEDMTTWNEVTASQRIVSIQVQTTRLTGAGVEIVPYKGGNATHWSIYTRNADGIATWVEDFALGGARADTIFGSVMVKAAKLSMEHQAFIEELK